MKLIIIQTLITPKQTHACDFQLTQLVICKITYYQIRDLRI